MNTPLIFILAIFIVYCIGSLSFAIIISKIMQLPDPRSVGSQNPGATNVLRSGNKIAAALTLLGDTAKGWLAVWLAYIFATTQPLPSGMASLLIFSVAIAVLIGHMWPLFFHFQGGKGVSTALGIMLALSPGLALSVLTIWCLVAGLCRISSLAALIAALSAPFLALYWLADNTYIAAIFIVAILVLRRHKKNILNLFEGREKKLGE